VQVVWAVTATAVAIAALVVAGMAERKGQRLVAITLTGRADCRWAR
jgi:hypothetical protein